MEPPISTTPAVSQRPASRRTFWIGTLIALAVVAGLGWLAWSLTSGPPAASTPGAGPGAGPGGGGPGGPGGAGGAAARRGLTTVGVATAEKADVPITLEALGTVSPQATVRVRPQVSGVLQQVLFKEGQAVRKGELLAVIDPRPFEMSVQQALGQRQRDEAQLEAAKVQLQRYRTLLQQDSIARQEVDTQEAQVKQLEAAVVISKANEGTARLNLGYTRVVSPIAGRVGLRTVDVGNVISTGDANGVALVTQMAPIDVEFSVPQDQAPGLQRGGGAPLEVVAMDRTRSMVLATGSFASLDNQVDTTTGTVRAKARFDNADLALFPSQFVNVRLKMRTLEGAVVVPVAAVRNGSGGEYVFVLNADRTVSQRTVRRGQATADRVQIASGLQAGERVITEGADRLRDGARVTLPGDASGGAGRRRDGASAPAGGASGAASGARAQRQRSGEQGAGTAPAPAGGAAGGAVGGAAGEAPAVAARQRPASAEGGAPRAAPAGGGGGSGGAAKVGPTPEVRQRMLESVKDNPEQLERRKKFFEALDRGDPAAIERWKQLQEQRRQGGGGAPGSGG